MRWLHKFGNMIGIFIFGQHNKGNVKQSKEQKVTDFIKASLMASESDQVPTTPCCITTPTHQA